MPFKQRKGAASSTAPPGPKGGSATRTTESVRIVDQAAPIYKNEYGVEYKEDSDGGWVPQIGEEDEEVHIIVDEWQSDGSLYDKDGKWWPKEYFEDTEWITIVGDIDNSMSAETLSPSQQMPMSSATTVIAPPFGSYAQGYQPVMPYSHPPTLAPQPIMPMVTVQDPIQSPFVTGPLPPQPYASLNPDLGMDAANVVGPNDLSYQFDARGERIQDRYDHGGAPSQEGLLNMMPYRNDQAFSIKETGSIQDKMAFMNRILKPDCVCAISESFKPVMPTIQEEQLGHDEEKELPFAESDAYQAQINIEQDAIGPKPKLTMPQSAREGPTPASVKVVVFDFDCTLTLHHAYGILAGTHTGHNQGIKIPPPFSAIED